MAAPGNVTELTVEDTTSTTVTLSWTNPRDLDLTNIILRRLEGDTAPGLQEGTIVALNGPDTETVVDEGLDPETEYTYAIWAKNEDDEFSAEPDFVSATTTEAVNVIGTPHDASLYSDPSWSTPAETEAANELETRASRAGYSFEFEATKEAYQKLTGLQTGEDPVIGSIEPATGWVTAEETGVEVTVTGENFLASSVLMWLGEELDTTFVSATELTALVPGSAVEVTVDDFYVVNGPYSRSPIADVFEFEFIAVPTPVLSILDPASAQANEQDVEIMVGGENFIDLSIVNFDGTNVETTFVSATELTVTVSGADAADTVDVFVDNTEGEVSETVEFEFTVEDLPTITSLTPSTHVIGATPFSVTVAGTNFIDDVSVVNWDGVDLETTFVDVDELTVTAPASAAADTVDVVVSNGGAIVSVASTFTYTAE